MLAAASLSAAASRQALSREASKQSKKQATRQQRRGASELVIRGSMTGRSSVSGVIATVFGGTGFLGRSVISDLGKIGSQVVVPFRGEEKSYRHLKTCGDLGQIVPMRWDVRDRETIRAAVAHSNVVINMAGALRDTGNFTLEQVHVAGAAAIALAAKEAGVQRLIHVSAAGASPRSASRFSRTKFQGEEAVRAIFPTATILRPTWVFGPDDNLTNKLGGLARFYPVFPLSTPGGRRTQPLYHRDFAAALMAVLADPQSAGGIYDLGGPKTYTMDELVAFVLNQSFRRYRHVLPLPKLAAEWIAKTWYETTRQPRWTVEEIRRFHADDIVASPANRSISDLGVVPRSIEVDGVHQLRLYRSPIFQNWTPDETQKVIAQEIGEHVASPHEHKGGRALES